MSDGVWVCNGVEFKVGNKVRVVRQVETGDEDGMGTDVKWDNSWNEEMDKYLGLEFTIDLIDTHGAEFESEAAYGYAFPLLALENLSV